MYLPLNRTLFTLDTVLLKLPKLGEAFPRNGWTDVKSIQRDVTDWHLYLEKKNQKIWNMFQEVHWACTCTKLLFCCNWNIGYGKVLIWKAAQKNSVRTEPEDVSNWSCLTARSAVFPMALTESTFLCCVALYLFGWQMWDGGINLFTFENYSQWEILFN